MSHAARASECSLRMTRRGFRECGNFAEIELSVRRGRSPDRPAYSTGNGPMRAEGELPKKRYGLPRQCAHRLAMTEKSFFRQERLAWAIGPYDADRPLLAVGAPIRRPLSCVSFRRAADKVNLVKDQREGGLGHSRPYELTEKVLTQLYPGRIRVSIRIRPGFLLSFFVGVLCPSPSCRFAPWLAPTGRTKERGAEACFPAKASRPAGACFLS